MDDDADADTCLYTVNNVNMMAQPYLVDGYAFFCFFSENGVLFFYEIILDLISFLKGIFKEIYHGPSLANRNYCFLYHYVGVLLRNGDGVFNLQQNKS